MAKRVAGFVSALLACNLTISAQEESASPAAEKKSYPEVPKEYEVGESTISPDGRFAILYEVRDEDSNVDPGLPNLLVRLKPYAELEEIENNQGVTWKDGRGAPEATPRLNGLPARQLCAAAMRIRPGAAITPMPPPALARKRRRLRSPVMTRACIPPRSPGARRERSP